MKKQAKQHTCTIPTDKPQPVTPKVFTQADIDRAVAEAKREETRRLGHIDGKGNHFITYAGIESVLTLLGSRVMEAEKALIQMQYRMHNHRAVTFGTKAVYTTMLPDELTRELLVLQSLGNTLNKLIEQLDNATHTHSKSTPEKSSSYSLQLTVALKETNMTI